MREIISVDHYEHFNLMEHYLVRTKEPYQLSVVDELKQFGLKPISESIFHLVFYGREISTQDSEVLLQVIPEAAANTY